MGKISRIMCYQIPYYSPVEMGMKIETSDDGVILINLTKNKISIDYSTYRDLSQDEKKVAMLISKCFGVIPFDYPDGYSIDTITDFIVLYK